MVRAVNFVYGGCRAAAFFAFLLFTFSFGLGQGLPIASPQSTGMNAAKLNQIEQLVNADIADKKLPGAVIIIGHRGKIVYRKAFGKFTLRAGRSSSEK